MTDPAAGERAMRLAPVAVLLGLLWITTAAVAEPPLVPPADELEILDPGIDPLGKPAAVVRDGEIDIAPTIIVHRFYYTGNRSFQGPLLPGGPCILAVHHPRTGELLYLPAQMLPGAPRICYRNDCIIYDFGRREMRLHFGHRRPFGRYPDPTISYHQSSPNRTPAPLGKKPPGPLAQQLAAVGSHVVNAADTVVQAVPLGAAARSAVEAQIATRRTLRTGSRLPQDLTGTLPTVQ